jgi:hypothetical protein
MNTTHTNRTSAPPIIIHHSAFIIPSPTPPLFRHKKNGAPPFLQTLLPKSLGEQPITLYVLRRKQRNPQSEIHNPQSVHPPLFRHKKSGCTPQISKLARPTPFENYLRGVGGGELEGQTPVFRFEDSAKDGVGPTQWARAGPRVIFGPVDHPRAGRGFRSTYRNAALGERGTTKYRFSRDG